MNELDAIRASRPKNQISAQDRNRALGSMRALLGLDDRAAVMQPNSTHVTVVDLHGSRKIILEQCTVGHEEPGNKTEIISWRAGHDITSGIWFCTEPQRGAVYDVEPPIIMIKDEEAQMLLNRRSMYKELEK